MSYVFEELNNGLATLEDKIYYKTQQLNLSYSAGSVGTRGAQGSIQADSGAYIIGTAITYVSDSSRFIPVIFAAGNTVYCNLYRCDGNALANGQVSVRVTYMRV